MKYTVFAVCLLFLSFGAVATPATDEGIAASIFTLVQVVLVLGNVFAFLAGVIAGWKMSIRPRLELMQ